MAERRGSSELHVETTDDFLMRKAPLAAVIGVASGLLSGLLGVGGGAIAVPAMVALLGVSQHRAHGTSLAMIVITAPVSALAYAVQGNVDWAVALALAVGMAVGAVLGARATRRISPQHLKQGFALLILAVAARLLMG